MDNDNRGVGICLGHDRRDAQQQATSPGEGLHMASDMMRAGRRSASGGDRSPPKMTPAGQLPAPPTPTTACLASNEGILASVHCHHHHHHYYYRP